MFNNIIENHDYVVFFENTIVEFGGIYRNRPKYVMRRNIEDVTKAGSYYGCISSEEAESGPYSDLSIVVFPSNEANDDEDRWLISLALGSLGYKNDDALASLPGIRRRFIDALDENSFVKNSFMDNNSVDGIKSMFTEMNAPNSLINCVGNYGRLLFACTIFDPNDINTSESIIRRYLALYADLRGWADNRAQRDAIAVASESIPIIPNEEDDVRDLLTRRKYVVLQGAPGTGKTRLAKKLASDTDKDNVFFTQFHAETAYSDFIYGIVPDIDADTLRYKQKKGIFVEAIERAKEVYEQNKKVYLIIDEINRANLSNVLGQAFYLFEPTMADSDILVELSPDLKIDKLPENLFVIATMNTADRSLAVVDFALRRRFAWYTMYPHIIDRPDEDHKYFCDKEFNDIAKKFRLYASDDELNLQPGQAYFIVEDDNPDERIKMRLQYEIMPLIKEYLMDDMLTRAKDDFVNYFRRKLNVEMFL